mmetsp:Transcript_23827/g.80367  ORF Transcript_23827/g.80367 Transcript_23827/m.80367 type:complete len:217 (+) Transcript_23827:630-1280(+)
MLGRPRLLLLHCALAPRRSLVLGLDSAARRGEARRAAVLRRRVRRLRRRRGSLCALGLVLPSSRVARRLCLWLRARGGGGALRAAVRRRLAPAAARRRGGPADFVVARRAVVLVRGEDVLFRVAVLVNYALEVHFKGHVVGKVPAARRRARLRAVSAAREADAALLGLGFGGRAVPRVGVFVVKVCRRSKERGTGAEGTRVERESARGRRRSRHGL